MRKLISVGLAFCVVCACMFGWEAYLRRRLGIRVVSAQQTMTLNGVANQSTAVGGFVPIYNPNGTLITNARCVQSIATTNASGQWSMNYNAMGFSTITNFSSDAANPTASVLITNQYIAVPNLPSATTFTGIVMYTVSVSIAGITVNTLQLASSGAQVSLRVCGY